MKSLPVRWRPTTFDEVIGQGPIIDILKRQINMDKVSHAYLFSGSSGCGKTTVARILANEINHGAGSPIEIDAASNNGVDNVREIIRTACERSIDSEYKVFIIDEAHALSSQAWQAFLKCIEEPPMYTIFIFCTTERNKVPNTIKNRCMTLNFSRVSSQLIYERLEYISVVEGLENYKETCEFISKNCDGQVRLALSMLEKCSMQGNDISFAAVKPLFDTVSDEDIANLFDNMIDGNESGVVEFIDYVYNGGYDITRVVLQLIDFVINVCKYIIFGTLEMTEFQTYFEPKLKSIVNFTDSKSYYNYYLDSLLKLVNELKTCDSKKSMTTAFLLKMTLLQEI